MLAFGDETKTGVTPTWSSRHCYLSDESADTANKERSHEWRIWGEFWGNQKGVANLNESIYKGFLKNQVTRGRILEEEEEEEEEEDPRTRTSF